MSRDIVFVLVLVGRLRGLLLGLVVCHGLSPCVAIEVAIGGVAVSVPPLSLQSQSPT
jgi:hypothetical protein